MESVLIAALVAAAPIAQPGAEPAPAPLDLRCFRLMAELAGDEDPRIRSMGRIAAQYFLGRIDAAEPGFDPEAALAEPVSDEDRGRLLRQCGDVMGAGGRDFRAIGEALAPPARPTA